MHTSILDEQIFATIERSEKKIEEILNCNIVAFYGEITPDVTRPFIRTIEEICKKADYKKDTIAIC